MKHYKAIFFDWDGTAVLSRKAPVEDAVNAMRPLLDKGVKLCIVSGTTYENIAGGKLHSYFTPKQLENLYLGLGRGAFDYGYNTAGEPTVLVDRVPDAKGILAVHDACYRIHRELLEKYGMNTDIVFSRPNYCKIDLMPANNRGENLFLQEGEAARLQHILQQHGIDSIETVIAMAESFGTPEMPLCATTDAKYLEVGISCKSDNVDVFLERFKAEGITAEDCSFWGDEFVEIEHELYGSDSFMYTEKSKAGDFFDVSAIEGKRPEAVIVLGGGVHTFLTFLKEQA